MDFLDIEQKVDSQAKLAQAYGKPTENYLFAAELNKIVQAINTLKGLQLLNQQSITAILTQNRTVGLAEVDDVLTAFNALPYRQMIAPVYITATIHGVDYVYAFTGSNGYYGAGRRQLMANDIIMIYRSDEQAQTINTFGFDSIIINDIFCEYFFNIESARQCISQFGFPAPINDFYDNDSGKYYIWYNKSYLNTITVLVNSATEQSFGENSHVTISDISGYITAFQGTAFLNNLSDYNYPGTNILNNVTFLGYGALSWSQTNFYIKYLYYDLNGFAGNASGDFQIDFAYLACNRSFDNYSGFYGNKLKIKNLLAIPLYFGVGSSGTIEIDNCAFDKNQSDSFYANFLNSCTDTVVHIPAISRSSNFGNKLADNISHGTNCFLILK